MSTKYCLSLLNEFAFLIPSNSIEERQLIELHMLHNFRGDQLHIWGGPAGNVDIIIIPLDRWENSSTERSDNLPVIKQLGSGK